MQYAGRDAVHGQYLDAKRVNTLGVASLVIEVSEVAYVGEAEVLLELIGLE